MHIFHVLSFFGTVLVWVGIFNLGDYYTFESTLVLEICQLLFALTLMAMCTYFNYSHGVQQWVKSCITLFAGILAWKSTWNLCEYYLFEPSMQRELLYTFSGIFLLLVTSTFHQNSKSIFDVRLYP